VQGGAAILEHNQGITVQPNYSPDPSEHSAPSSAPTRRNASGDRTRQKYNRLIDSPELQDLTFLEKEFLRQRWLDQMIWFSDKASLYRDRHYRIRIVTVIGSILVPAMISLGSVCTGAFFLQLPETTSVSPAPAAPSTESVAPPVASPPSSASVSLAWSRFFLFTGLGLSQIVAILAGVDQFFKFGDRWRHYRSTAELLKTHGWQFLELSGPYESYTSNGQHKAAFPVFANQIEEIIQSDVDGYVTQIATQKSINQGIDNTRF
jgi:hypothetical protein